ncbi:hypothetical protein BGX27_001009 [Mortierella sp. AM989]|nr:hypothetical protein BGX27_001009 [Mortierella sp. AM989]
MASNKKSKSRAMPALPTSPAPCLTHSLQNEDWPAEAQKVNEEQMAAFYREYAKTAPEKGTILEPDEHIRRITAALAHYTPRGHPGGKALPEEFLRQSSERILSPSPEELMELYATLLRDNLDLNPKMREVLTDQTFAASTLLHGDQLDQHFLYHQQHSTPQQRVPCRCPIDHEDDTLFPEDSYEDEPDDEEDDDEDDDEDDEDEEDSMDEEDYEDEDDQDVGDGYAHHYEEKNVKMMAYEDEKLKLEAVRRVREEERRLKEEFRKKKITDRMKQKQEKEQIARLQRLRLEDEERRKRETLEKQRKEKLEEEMRKKREAGMSLEQDALACCTMRSQIETVKQIVGATPDDSCSLTGVPRFSTTAATRLFGWEFMTMVEGVGEVSEEKGVQETLLHVAVRVGCIDLVIFFIDKGAPLDALDKDGLTPLHTAAKHSSPFEICKLLAEKTVHHIDRTCIISGKTILHYAAQNGNAELVSLLLQYHARINPVDLKGNTPEALAKSGLETTLSEKSKANSKKTDIAKAQKYRNTLQHLQKAMAALKEAQSRKDAQLEEQRRKDEALAREEAEKDNAARKKQEEKLEADLRRRLEEEKELERLKAVASDPSGNNNNSNKKKKKKKGNNKNDTKETQASTSSTFRIEPSDSATLNSNPSFDSKTIQSQGAPGQLSDTKTLQHSEITVKATQASSVSQQAPARIPKPKTTYRPSQLVVSRMTDMGFPLRESRKALVQTSGKVEDAIELLTSNAQLADDSEDEAEQVAERAKAKAKASAINAVKTVQTKVQEIRPLQQPIVSPPQNHATHLTNSQNQQQQQLQQQHHHRVTHGAGLVAQQPAPRPANHPVQILQRTHVVAPHMQPRSVPTQVLQRPLPHSQHSHQQMSPQHSGLRKSLSNQGAPMASSPTLHPATTIASFIAPRTAQPVPPSRAPYSYGPTSSTQNLKPMVSPTIHSSHLSQSPPFKASGSISASALDRSAVGRSSAGDINTIGMTRKFGSMDLSEHQSFSTSTSFPGFPAATSTWEMNMGNKGLTPTSLELPVPASAGFQPSSMGHNPWAAPGLSLPGPSLLQSVNENSTSSSFGSPFLTSLPTNHHQQHQNLRQQHSRSSPVMASLGGLQGYGEGDLDLGNAGGEMIKDVLAMTGALDSDEFAKFEAEYSLLGSTRSNNGPSRAVGGGRNNSTNGNSGQPMANLWGTNSTNDGSNDGTHGSPSPIGTVNGHARRFLDAGFDSNGSNGLLSESNGGGSEYSQWNSGFALGQTVYPRQQQQQQVGSSAFVDSFFGSGSGVIPSPYNQHLLAHQHSQPLSPFDFSGFGGLGGSAGSGGSAHGSTNPNASLTSPTASTFGSIALCMS